MSQWQAILIIATTMGSERMQERNGMEPSVSIHHFVHPAWFEALGGWTKEENIQLYVNFAVEAFTRFGKHAETWSSFNEPTVSCALYPPVYLWMCTLHAMLRAG